MSSPMFDVPEHFPIPLNNYGQGPEEDIAKIEWWVCWCNDPLCPRFQVAGRDYRDAVEVLEKKGTSRLNAELVVQSLIQLGWVLDPSDPVAEAVERSKELPEPSDG